MVIISDRRRAVLPLFFAALANLAVAQGPLSTRLPENARGAAAVTVLGPHLPTVAHAHGLDETTLTHLFNTQPGLGVDRDGALMFACEGLTVRVQQGSPANVPTTSGPATVNLLTGAGTDAL